MNSSAERIKKRQFPSQEELGTIEDAEILDEKQVSSGASESADDINAVTEDFKADLLKEGYPEKDVEFFMQKALRPLIGKSDFSDTNVVQTHIERILSNFRKEQDMKKGSVMDDVSIEAGNKNKETLRAQASEEYARRTPKEMLDDMWDAEEAGRVHTPQEETTENSIEKSIEGMIAQIERLQTLVNTHRDKAGLSHNEAGVREKLAGYVSFKLHLGQLKKKLQSYEHKTLTKEDIEAIKGIRSKIASYGRKFHSALQEHNKNEKKEQNIQWSVGDTALVPRTDGSYTQAVIQINYLNGTVGMSWEENGTKLSKRVSLDDLRPVDSSVQQDKNLSLKHPSHLRKNRAPRNRNGTRVSIERTEAHTIKNREQNVLFGMQIPKAGPGGIFGVRAFKQALELIERRTLPELQEDPQKRKQYNEILQIVSNVPDSGLTQEEIDRLAVLTQSIAMPESPLHFDMDQVIDTMNKDVEEKVAQQLPSIHAIKKKRGFFGKLARAAVLSFPFIVGYSALDKQVPISSEKDSITSVTADASTDDIAVTTIHRPAPRPPIEGDTPQFSDTQLSHKEKINDTKKQPRVEVIETTPADESGYPYTYTDADVTIGDVADPKSPRWVEDVEFNGVEYTFEKDSPINSVSEALLDKWHQQRTILNVPVSENECKSALYAVLSDLEKDIDLSKEIAQKMHINSLDINTVAVGQTIDLQPLIDLLNKKLQ